MILFKEKPKLRRIKLTDEEIHEIIKVFEDVPQGVYSFMKYHKIVDKFKTLIKQEGVRK